MTKPSRFPEVRREKYAYANSFSMNVDLESIDDLITELGAEIDDAARPAAQAGAQVLYDEAMRNVEALGSTTGKLRQAIYQVYSQSHSGPDHATYFVSWNSTKAPHGGLVEFGHIQRYATYLGKDGNWHTAVRPSMKGRPRPKRNAAQAVKDAYYVLRKEGPVQVGAKAFLRRAMSKEPQAVEAVRAELLRRISRDG